MKKGLVLLFACSSFVFFSCEKKTNENSTNEVSQEVSKVEEPQNDSTNFPKMDFEHTEFNFGDLKAGEKAEHIYKFVNSGTSPLIITDARASCGCTIPEYSKEPILPKASGEIKVIFNSAGKSGEQNKSITITANTKPEQTVVYLKGMVEEVSENK